MLAAIAGCGQPPLAPEIASRPITVFATIDWDQLSNCAPCGPFFRAFQQQISQAPGPAGKVLRQQIDDGAVHSITTAVPLDAEDGFVALDIAVPAEDLSASFIEAGGDCEERSGSYVCELPPAKQPLALVPSEQSTTYVLSPAPSSLALPATRQTLEHAKAPLSEQPLLAYAYLQTLPFTELMSDPPEGWLNLSILANALRWTAEAQATLRLDNGVVRLEIKALTDSPDSAQKTAELLGGLSSFAQAAWNWGDPDTARAWAAVFESAEFSTDGAYASGHWRIPGELIETLLEEPAAPAAGSE